MGVTLTVDLLLFNLFPAKSLPDGSWFFFTQHFHYIPLYADHGPKVIFVTISGLYVAFSGSFLLRTDGKLGHSNGELDPMTNAFIQMSGVFAELELRIIRERVHSGMRNARAKGARIGRPQTTLDDIPANFLRHYPQYKKGAFNLTELARLCAISRTTAYKYIGLLEGSTAICR